MTWTEKAELRKAELDQAAAESAQRIAELEAEKKDMESALNTVGVQNSEGVIV